MPPLPPPVPRALSLQRFAHHPPLSPPAPPHPTRPPIPPPQRLLDWCLTSSRLLKLHGLARLRDACYDLLVEAGGGRPTSVAYLRTHRQTGLDVVHAMHVYATQYAFLDPAIRHAQLVTQTQKFGNGAIMQARAR